MRIQIFTELNCALVHIHTITRFNIRLITSHTVSENTFFFLSITAAASLDVHMHIYIHAHIHMDVHKFTQQYTRHKNKRAIYSHNNTRAILLPQNTIERLPPVGRFVGRYNGVSFAFTISRHTGYYLTQVVLILCILTMLGWAAFGISNNVAHFSGEIANNDTHSLKSHEFVIDNTILVGRLNHLMRVILACVAFQYVVRASLPRVHYMTTMDGIILCTTLNVFAIALETVILRQLTNYDFPVVVYWVDRVCSILIPLSFVVPVIVLIAVALTKRNSKRTAYTLNRWPNGVQPSLCISEAECVSAEINTVKKMRSMRLPGKEGSNSSLRRLRTQLTYAPNIIQTETPRSPSLTRVAPMPSQTQVERTIRESLHIM